MVVMAKTVTDEIVEKVKDVMDLAPVHPDSGSQGTVFGEDHMNEEFTFLMARRFIPELSQTLAPDRERILHVEWDRSPETLGKLEKFMETGDPDIRDALVRENYNVAGRDMGPVHEAWGELLDSARTHGFKIEPFDEEKHSLDSYYHSLAKEIGKEVRDFTREEADLAGDRRIAESNPAMIKNIQDNTPEGAYSIVMVGDLHARRADDLPEELGYSYLRFTEGSDHPDISKDKAGADLDVQLVNRQIASDFTVENVTTLGIDALPIFLDDIHVPEWCSDDNKGFLSALGDEMLMAARMVQTQQYDKAIEKIDGSMDMITERYTDEQIHSDDYLQSFVDVLDASRGVVVAEMPEAPDMSEVQKVSQTEPVKTPDNTLTLPINTGM